PSADRSEATPRLVVASSPSAYSPPTLRSSPTRRAQAHAPGWRGRATLFVMSASNLLATEASPYLRQHARDPVHWHPWGDAAFERARAEQKPLLVSIGYASCHW